MKSMHKLHLAGIKNHLAGVQREMSAPPVVVEHSAFASLPPDIQLALEVDFGSQVQKCQCDIVGTAPEAFSAELCRHLH